MAKQESTKKAKQESTEKDPRGTHTGKDGRQVPNNPGPLAKQYKKQTGKY